MPNVLSKRVRSSLIYLLISIGVTALVILLTQDVVFEFAPLQRAELSFIDARFQYRGTNPTIHDSSKVIIVEISQESFKSVPDKWPWPRTYFAKLIRNLKLAGAKAVGIDIVFSSGDQLNPDNDKEFRKALRETGNVVLAGKMEEQKNEYTLLSGNENYGNYYIDSSSLIGFVNTRGDADGVLRRYIPFVVDPGRQLRLPTFSLAILNAYYGKDKSYTAEPEDSCFHYLDKPIPSYDEISFLINYYGYSGTFRRMNFANVIDDKDFKTTDEIDLETEINTFDDSLTGYLYDGTFKDKIVLVGSTQPEDKDLFFVPIGEGKQSGDNQMYGVEVHANVIQNIIDNNFITRQPLWLTILIVLVLSLFTFVLTASLKAIKSKRNTLVELLGIAIILAEALIVYAVSMKLFVTKSYLTDMTSPFLAIVLSYLGSTVYNYLTERKQKVMIKNMFSHYVNRDVVNELVEHPDRLQLTGDRREMTVVFTDIENFTTLAEKMKAEDLVTVLNEYLNEMTSIIFSNRGTVDKYEGDAIMAFWGAPIPHQDHALQACKTAVEMQYAIVTIRERWKAAGLQPIHVRIGINTGEMIVGNIGGSGKYEYTVIGDSVNLGARLESANKQYRTNIMISESTYRKIADQVIARELDMLVVAGKTEPIRVYELIGLTDGNITPERKRFMDYYTTGLAHYRKREWKIAVEHFEKALEIYPEDYPSQIYVERSHLYQASPPPDNWNGVFILRTK